MQYNLHSVHRIYFSVAGVNGIRTCPFIHIKLHKKKYKLPIFKRLNILMILCSNLYFFPVTFKGWHLKNAVLSLPSFFKSGSKSQIIYTFQDYSNSWRQNYPHCHISIFSFIPFQLHVNNQPLFSVSLGCHVDNRKTLPALNAVFWIGQIPWLVLS